MPFIWQQSPNLQWAPKPTVLEEMGTNRMVMKRHFAREQGMSYGEN